MSNLYVDTIQPFTISGSLTLISASVTGSLQGTASFAVTSTSASFANTASFATTSTSASFATTASFINPLNQTVTLTGSAVGNLSALSISSNTASLDCRVSNLFTLQLVSGSNTFINPTNVQAGQTFNLLVSTTGSATVSFPAIVKQVSGSAYVPTTTVAIDVLSFIARDSSTLLLANIKNLV